MRDNLPVWAEQLIVFDTETTGVSTAQARIVSATCAVLERNGETSERYDWMIDPGVEIPDAAAQVHGITTEMARAQGMQAAHGIAQIVDKLQEMLDRGLALVVYNAPFDLSLLQAEAVRHGAPFLREVSPVLDPLLIDKQLDKYRKGKRTLGVVSAHYGVTLEDAHDAGADAIAAGQVMQALGRKYHAQLPDDVLDLHTQQVQWALAQAADFQAYMRRVRDPNFTARGEWPVAP